MHVIDQEVCVGCKSCKRACPVGAVSPNGEGKFTIASTCVDCGSCARKCPVKAISEYVWKSGM